MVVTTNKEPIHFFISEGSMHDVTAYLIICYRVFQEVPL
jgi:hypothetical protein